MKAGKGAQKIPREIGSRFDQLLHSAVWEGEMGLNFDSLPMWLQWLALADCPARSLSSHRFNSVKFS